MADTPTFLLIDGHSLAFRAFYAFAYRGEGLRTSTGIPTSVCYGFLNSLLEILGRERPDAVAIAFDLAAPTFRHEADASYKANRSETPEEFIPDLLNLQRLLATLNLQIVTHGGYEADDVLGTLSQWASAAGYQVKILSGDRDLFQLIDSDKRITVLHLGQKDRIQEFTAVEVQEKMGVFPHQVVDYKALCGDSSDNIPGVRGIGEKTAVKLLQEYHSLEQVLASLPMIKGAIAQKLQAGIEDARHSQYLARIALDVPLTVDLETCRLRGFHLEQVTPILEELEFHALKRKVDALHQRLSPAPATAPSDDELWFDFAESATTPLPPIAVQIIDTRDKLEHLAHTLSQEHSPIAWDTETTSLNPHDHPIVGIGCCWGDAAEHTAYIPLAHNVGQNLAPEEVAAVLGTYFATATYPKVLQNAKFDRLMLRSIGVDLRGVIFDPMVASYVLDPEANHGLKDMARQYLGWQPQSYSDLVPKKQTIAAVPIPDVAQYCAMDAHMTLRLYPILGDRLKERPELERLFYDVELPLEAVLADLEWLGIRIDAPYLAQLSQQLEQDLVAIAQTAYDQAGREFNLNSPRQLADVLQELLGETFTKKSRKSQTGYSTDVSVLTKLEDDHPLIPTILEHRTLSKLKSTYVDALPSLIHPRTGRLHTDFNQTITATGRLSSSNPNLQNIPIRTALSRQIRAAFVPQADWLLVAADYSQIELRILAHLSQEPELLQAYRDGIDVHTHTAQLLLQKDTITSEERRMAKIINYGVVYGMGAQKFSRDLGIALGDAKEFIAAFYRTYARVFEYLRHVEEAAERDGYVTTALGRRRYFRNLDRLNKPQKAAMLRSAINAPIQGTSADIIKVAMIQIQQLLEGYQSRMLLQVHDELVFEMPPEEMPILQPQIQALMEGAIALSVPLEVEIHSGQNWMTAK
ncbi:MAG: DNA polymerase I [Oscillatoriales cyanobacterium SM2_2_1]|nr:DNA polymerase I [Oscillatoriales cyanobacterium SM2_2_1]